MDKDKHLVEFERLAEQARIDARVVADQRDCAVLLICVRQSNDSNLAHVTVGAAGVDPERAIDVLTGVLMQMHGNSGARKQ